jgi:hypothetical protein
MAHTFKQYAFVPRVTNTLFRMLEAIDDEVLPPIPAVASSTWQLPPS